jgi:chemotaxis protein CheX
VKLDAHDRGRWTEQIDGTVAAVFEQMLGLSCAVAKQSGAGEPDISAKVLFSGAMQGCCVVEFPVAAARRLTDRFLGTAERTAELWDRAMVEDAVGELCNMIAGGWKSGLGSQNSGCELSLPIMRRAVGQVELSGCGGTKVRRVYGFDGEVFAVELMIR